MAYVKGSSALYESQVIASRAFTLENYFREMNP